MKDAHTIAIEQIARAMAELAWFRLDFSPSIPAVGEVDYAIRLVGITSGAQAIDLRCAYRDAYEAQTRELVAAQRKVRKLERSGR
jgi:hypothetical protein